MRMKRLADLVRLAWLVILVAIVACGDVSKEELASMAAKGYYDHLIQGEYEQFLEGSDMLPEDAAYRSQLLDNYRQFMEAQQKDHNIQDTIQCFYDRILY